MSEKLKSFFKKFDSSFEDLWTNNKIFLLIFGFVILVVKYRETFIALLGYQNKKDLEAAQKQDVKLEAQESDAKTEAAKLIDHARSTPSLTETDPDWNKK